MAVQGAQYSVQAVFRAGAFAPFAGVAAVHGENFHVLPGQAEPGAGELHRGQIGQHLAGLDAQPRLEKGRDAVAQRVAGGEHHHAPVFGLRAAYPLRHLIEFSGEIAAFGVRGELFGKEIEHARAADDEIGLLDVRQRARRQPVHAVVQHADDAAWQIHGAFPVASAILLPSKSHTRTFKVNCPG